MIEGIGVTLGFQSRTNFIKVLKRKCQNDSSGMFRKILIQIVAKQSSHFKTISTKLHA